MTFSEKVRKHRKALGMTQAELAQKLGVTCKTIINYENGTTYPRKREMYTALAAILGVEPGYLRNEEDDFIEEARQQYGYRGKKQAEELVAQIGGLFAGGELSETEKDGVMKALQEVYWKCKEDNAKYAPKKHAAGDNK